MPTPLPWASKVFRHLIKPHVAVIHLQQKLYGTLQPHMKTAHTDGFKKDGVVQIPQYGVFKPSHQKSSADGMRL